MRLLLMAGFTIQETWRVVACRGEPSIRPCHQVALPTAAPSYVGAIETATSNALPV